MNYEKLFKVLVEKLGREEIGKIVIRNTCPSSFGWSIVKDCGTDQQNCRKCWAKALGMDEEAL